MDIIDKSIEYNRKKGKSASVIKRYVRMKYRINIDIKALKERMRQMERFPKTKFA